MKRFFAALLTVVMLLTLLPAGAQAKASYTSDWRRWSQGASGIKVMNKGCRLVAQAKLMAEAGVVPKGFNPDTWYEWMAGHSGLKDGTVLERYSSQTGDKMLEYLKSQGVSAKRAKTVTLTKMSAKERVNAIMSYINQGYYIILEKPNHQTYVSRVDSLKAKKPVISDSGGSIKRSAMYYYSGKNEPATGTGKYYNKTKKQTLSCAKMITGGTLDGTEVESGKTGCWTASAYTTAYLYTIGTPPSPVANLSYKAENLVGGVRVTLSTSTSGATIYYTTNGKTPTNQSTQYTGPITLKSTTTLKAVGIKTGLRDSGTLTKTVTVNACTTPTIDCRASAAGYRVTITANSGATIYYTTNGQTPTTSSAKYTGQITVGETTTIKAIAVKSGMANSSVASVTCKALTPAVPKPARGAQCAERIGVGDNLIVAWGADSVAESYRYTILRDGEAFLTDTTEHTMLSMPLTEPGVYTVTVRAENFLYNSAESAPVTVTVMPDVTVSFVDYDGTELSTQTIKYGGSAQPPAAPQRVGHTFSRWNGSYSAVTRDTVVTAAYVPNIYTVRFVDTDGNALATESVEYGQAVKNVPQAPARPGYTFTGWGVRSGEGNSYETVNGDVVFAPIYSWNTPGLPVYLTVDHAVRAADAKGYTLEISAVNSGAEALDGKLVSVIKTSAGKVIVTKIETVTIPGGETPFTKTINIAATGVGVTAEVYLIANDSVHENRTGGPYAARASADVTMEQTETVSYWSDWSDWSTAAPPEGADAEQKTQYSYRDKVTTTSTNANLAASEPDKGWTQTGSSVTYGAWGSWSGWSTTKQTASNTKAVETRTVYVYQHYCDGSGNIAPSTKYSYGKYGPHTLYFTSKKAVSRNSSTGYTITDGLTKCAKGATSYYYWGTATQYRYRTRTATTTYTYERWGDYSAWSDTPVTGSADRQVRERTVWRYRTLETAQSTTEAPYLGDEDLTGEPCSVSGALDTARDYSGKTAVVMVYKDRNVDPTEDQMEYIGEITLGSGNRYDFSFIPREPLSTETGNYIVSFGVATADGLINNAEIIEAPKPEYTVTFRDVSGETIATRRVAEGDDAEAPALPEHDGYTVSWDRSCANIRRDTVVTAVTTPLSYPVVFVDWANSTVVDLTILPYGSELTFPADRTAEGKIFTGWSCPAGSLVSGSMVVEAQYEDVTFEATFLNDDGSVFATQTVPYGESVVLPDETPTAEGKQFLSWSTVTNWWNVTEDVTIAPIFVYADTVETPVYSEVTYDETGMGQMLLETPVENAEIHYTTDGSVPTLDDPVLTDGVLRADVTTSFAARAFCADMNDSDVAFITFTVDPDPVVPEIYADPEDEACVVGTDTAVIPLQILNPTGEDIVAYGVRAYESETERLIEQRVEQTIPASQTLLESSVTLTGLLPDTTYTYRAYVEFAQSEDFESDDYLIMTLEGDTPPAPQNPFTDVPSSEYYYDAVLWAVNHTPQITNGTSPTTFSPETTCTRGQVVTFLWRAMGEPEPTSTTNPFTDVPSGEYYYNAVLWAVENGITNGTSPTTFSPDDPCTRAHVVTFLWRAEQQPAAGSTTNPFTDVPAGQYFTDAVLWAVSKSITNGTSPTTFSPDNPCTRGQIVTFLYRDMK